MNIHTLDVREALRCGHAVLRELLRHPAMTDQDKPALIQAGNILAEIERRHMGRFTPVDPASLPSGVRILAFVPVPGLPKGWLVEHENREGVGQ